jgi:hypothetical protein
MMWIDIGVTVLVTLRLALFRSALPQLMDPTHDAWLPEGKDGTAGAPFGCDGEVNELSGPKSSSRNRGHSLLHIHVIPDSKVRR